MLLRTPFYDFHLAARARMVDFAGWEMPLLYRGIIEEHLQTRRSGSLFDISHMGRISISGPGAHALLDRILTRRISDQQIGQSRYSLVCNSAGGVLDDVIISRDQDHWLLVCNASNRLKILEHCAAVAGRHHLDAQIDDQTISTAMLALQGPAVIERVARLLPVDLHALKRYHFTVGNYMGLARFTVFRSGYTGEDGLEIIIPARLAAMGIKMFASKATDPGAAILPAGLGARDTLRLEAAMPLYGHELSEQTDPISTGLAWAVDLAKDFIGADSLRSVAERGPTRKLVGLELAGKRIARQGAPVAAGGKPVGQVTSGTFAPTLQKSIAMAYVDTAAAQPGTSLQVDLKGALVEAVVVELPFYHRAAAS